MQVGHPDHGAGRPGRGVDERMHERPVGGGRRKGQRPGAGRRHRLKHGGGGAGRRAAIADDHDDLALERLRPRRRVRIEHGEKVGEGARGHGGPFPVVAQAASCAILPVPVTLG